MKYYYKPSTDVSAGAGEIYICNHPLFNRATLFKQHERGLLLVQEHYNKKTKARLWGPVVPWLSYDIYANANFDRFFDENASEIDKNSLYPIFPVRKVMWALRMKPLQREEWESGL